MRLLAISDIHIDDYALYSPPGNRVRLLQSRVVAQNIIDVQKKYGIDKIVIAGDLVEKPIMRPYIQNESALFLKTIMKHFQEGYLIYGNHDLDAKSNDQVIEDSNVNLMLPPNLWYADNQVLSIDGITFGFTNWRPKIDLSFIQKNGLTKVNILFTHATICYSPSDKVRSQGIDETKFDIAFCGDIHKPAQKGKFVSIGIPQKCKMGDSDYCTGILIDTELYNKGEKWWDWVDLNPNKNLLNLVYTNQRNQEGYYKDINTYFVYKPDNIFIGVQNNTEQKVQEYQKIDEYVTATLTQNQNLSTIHGMVLEYLKTRTDDSTVDFNFVITHIKCHNWRSIEDCDLYLEDGDKILLLGENGSGKTSLLTAIKYAFLEYRSIKDFCQFGTKEKDMYTMVEFWYQGNFYTLLRGAKMFGLKINGNEEKYNKKTEFEADMHRRFPFIDYMDICFFDSDNSKLLGNMDSSRKSFILSKFLRLDKINIYNEVAEKIKEKISNDSKDLKNKIYTAQLLISENQRNLANTLIPTRSKEELEKQKNFISEAIKINNEWNIYENSTVELNTNIKILTNELSELYNDINSINIDDLNHEKTNLELERNECLNFSNEITRRNTLLTEKNKELQRLSQEIQKCKNDIEKVKSESICPHCGNTIPENQIEVHISEINNSINQYLKEGQNIQEEMKSLYYSQDDVNSKSEEYRNINSKISEIESKISEYNRKVSEYNRKSKEYSILSEKLKTIKSPSLPKQTLPDNYVSIIADIERDLANLKVAEEYRKVINDNTDILNSLSNQMGVLKAQEDSIKEYLDLTGPTGDIYKKILLRLKDEFSDSTVKYEVEDWIFRGKKYLELVPYYHHKNGNWVSYGACSSGQKTLLDVNYLSKTVSRMGFLIMDEFLKHLDPQNHDVCIDMIKGMNVGCIILSSHMESIAQFNNKTINLSLNDSGITKVEMK